MGAPGEGVKHLLDWWHAFCLVALHKQGQCVVDCWISDNIAQEDLRLNNLLCGEPLYLGNRQMISRLHSIVLFNYGLQV